MLSFDKARRPVIYTIISLYLRYFMNQKQENHKFYGTTQTFRTRVKEIRV